MIKVRVKQQNDEIVSITVTGHAGFAEHGEDIVCAAVSALTTNAVNGIDRLANFQPIVEVDQVEGGYLYVEMRTDISSEQFSIAQLLLKNLIYGLTDIETQYPQFINIERS